MPARPKTTEAEIVQAALDLIERKGRDGFSMNDVADAVGIRAPSLYNRFKDRAALLSAMEVHVCAQIADVSSRAIVANDHQATLMAQAKALRRFAKRNPNSYSLIFDVRSVPSAEGTSARAAALAPLLPSLSALAGEKNAFAAARVLIPYIHGFVSMELADAFRLGGGVNAAFERGVSVVIRGVARPFRV